MKIVLALLLSAVLIGCACRPGGIDQLATERSQCQRQVRSAAYCVFQYRSDHDGQFPSSLSEAIGPEAGSDKMVQLLSRCPAKPFPEYAYVNWSRMLGSTNVPPNYPVVYESEAGQHGAGVNVALMNGSAFWDEHCSWISEFAKKHPEYKLRVPHNH